MNRFGAAVLGVFVLVGIAMASTDTTSTDSHNVWHTYSARTPVAP